MDITTIVQSIGNTSEQIFVQLTMGYLQTQIPFFALPVIKQVTEFIIAKFIDLVVNKLELVTIDLVNFIKTADQQSDFIQAAQANAQAQISGDPNAIQQAQSQLIDAARNYFKLYRV